MLRHNRTERRRAHYPAVGVRQLRPEVPGIPGGGMNRRDLLKLFGVGATIVPVIDGMPKTDAPASLVKVPEVEIATAPASWMLGDKHLMDALYRRERIHVAVRLTSRLGVTDLAGESFITRVQPKLYDVTAFGDVHRQYVADLAEIEWEVKGVIVNDATVAR